MYDYRMQHAFQAAHVRDLIEVLNTLPSDALIECDGDNHFWLHVESDRSVVNIDSTEMDDEYEEGNTYPESNWRELHV